MTDTEEKRSASGLGVKIKASFKIGFNYTLLGESDKLTSMLWALEKITSKFGRIIQFKNFVSVARLIIITK